MSSWLSSLETVMRLQHWAIWFAIVSAVAAAGSGALSYYLSGIEASLRDKAIQEKLAAARSENEQGASAEREELAALQRQLVDSEARADELGERVRDLEKKLATEENARPKSVAVKPPPSRPLEPPSPEPSAILSAGQVSRLAAALRGQPSGEATLVSVSGEERSLAYARELESVLNGGGWTVTVIQAVFPTPPDELVFVVHSRDSLPPRQIALARALSESGLIQLPAKVWINPKRPTGYMGLVVPAPH